MKKFLIVSLSLVFLVPFVTSADTLSDLQAQVIALTAQVQQLIQQLAQMQGGTTAWCHTFNTDLQIGNSGTEVSALTSALIKNGISVTQTSTFDENVASAVSAFQQKYTSDVLTPAGLSSPTGYVGARTRAKLNALYGCGQSGTTNSNSTVQTAVGAATLTLTCPTGLTMNNTDGRCYSNDPQSSCGFGYVHGGYPALTPEAAASNTYSYWYATSNPRGAVTGKYYVVSGADCVPINAHPASYTVQQCQADLQKIGYTSSSGPTFAPIPLSCPYQGNPASCQALFSISGAPHESCSYDSDPNTANYDFSCSTSYLIDQHIYLKYAAGQLTRGGGVDDVLPITWTPPSGANSVSIYLLARPDSVVNCTNNPPQGNACSADNVCRTKFAVIKSVLNVPNSGHYTFPLPDPWPATGFDGMDPMQADGNNFVIRVMADNGTYADSAGFPIVPKNWKPSGPNQYSADTDAASLSIVGSYTDPHADSVWVDNGNIFNVHPGDKINFDFNLRPNSIPNVDVTLVVYKACPSGKSSDCSMYPDFSGSLGQVIQGGANSYSIAKNVPLTSVNCIDPATHNPFDPSSGYSDKCNSIISSLTIPQNVAYGWYTIMISDSRYPGLANPPDNPYALIQAFLPFPYGGTDYAHGGSYNNGLPSASNFVGTYGGIGVFSSSNQPPVCGFDNGCITQFLPACTDAGGPSNTVSEKVLITSSSGATLPIPQCYHTTVKNFVYNGKDSNGNYSFTLTWQTGLDVNKLVPQVCAIVPEGAMGCSPINASDPLQTNGNPLNAIIPAVTNSDGSGSLTFSVSPSAFRNFFGDPNLGDSIWFQFLGPDGATYLSGTVNKIPRPDVSGSGSTIPACVTNRCSSNYKYCRATNITYADAACTLVTGSSYIYDATCTTCNGNASCVDGVAAGKCHP